MWTFGLGPEDTTVLPILAAICSGVLLVRGAAMTTVHDVAKYFLACSAQAGDGDHDPITHLKLQKLVYYAQGYHLAIWGKPLFDDRFQAWAHGPVCPALWREYKDYGGDPIPPDPHFDPASIPSRIAAFLDEVYDVFGQYTAWRLRQMTHNEPTWQMAGPNGIITDESMRNYFSAFVTDDDQED